MSLNGFLSGHSEQQAEQGGVNRSARLPKRRSFAAIVR